MVVPIDIKKLFHQSVYTRFLFLFSNLIPECCSRTCHVLSQCSHHSIGSWAESDDVRCAKYKANDETDGCSDGQRDTFVVSLWTIELTSTHHCSHFDCRALIGDMGWNTIGKHTFVKCRRTSSASMTGGRDWRHLCKFFLAMDVGCTVDESDHRSYWAAL
jgi:hypothetical protein